MNPNDYKDRKFFMPLANAKIFIERFSRETLPTLKRSGDPKAQEIIETFKVFIQKVKEFVKEWNKARKKIGRLTTAFGRNPDIKIGDKTYKAKDVQDISVDLIPFHDEDEIKRIIDILAGGEEAAKRVTRATGKVQADDQGKVQGSQITDFFLNSNNHYQQFLNNLNTNP